MRKQFAIFITIFVLLYALLDYYIGLHGWYWVQAVAPALNGWAYWAPFWVLALAFPLARVLPKAFPRSGADFLAGLGAVWLSILQFSLPILVLIDLFRLINGWLGLVPVTAPVVALTGWAVVLLMAATMAYGIWRARTPVVVPYEIAIPKQAGDIAELHAVLVSDTHFGAINKQPRLRHMVQMVQDLKPDLLLYGGDMIDDDVAPFVHYRMADELARLKPPLGAFAILGNHDHGAGRLDEFQREMERAGIRLLVDEWVKVADSFYVIGRDDISGRRHTGRSRMPLPDLMAGIDPALPLILMDHQPYHLEEAEAAGIDLQVSGHTHRGQMFPYHLITRRHFELDWGYLKKGALHVVVSLGFGTWGPPMRIGNRPEVVSIRIRFANP